MDIQTLLRHLPEDVAKRLELRQRDIAYMEQLEAALAPFAAVGRALEDECHDPAREVWVFVVGMRGEVKALTVGDFLRAGKMGGGG